jgi:SAM-dependent methyltransferase
VGSGATRLHPAIVNLDLIYNSDLDCCGDAVALPFADAAFSLVVTQDVLEHVRDPSAALAEIYRVLDAHGTLYCQLPFIIGYHPGPTDFWRFSREGIRELIEKSGLVCEEIGIAVGPSYGFYWIAVEFAAVLASSLWGKAYKPVKGIMALLLAPVKLLDTAMSRSPQADRITGAYFVIAKKELHSRFQGV